MSLIRARSALLAKIESTYGTDPTPSAASDAAAIIGLQLGWPNEVHDRPILTNSLSPFAPKQGRKYGTAQFECELKGSGSAGTAPEWGPLMRACGFAEAVVASTSVTYTPASSSHESVTIYAYRDGLLYELNGARGDVNFMFPVGRPAMLQFNMQGFCVDPVDASLVTPTLDSVSPEVVVGASFSIGGYAATIAQLQLGMSNEIVVTDDLNAASGYGEHRITGRDPQGSFDPEATLIGTHDFWSDWEDETSQALSITLGATAGNIATFTSPAVINRQLSEGDRNGVLTYQIPFSACRSSGDDEVSLALT